MAEENYHLSPPRRCFSEFLATFIFLFFGLGAVHAAVLTDAQSGVWQIAIVWGMAIAISIYCFGAASGAHMNPAVTIALAVFRDFPKVLVVPYILAQVAGGFCAGAFLFFIFQGWIIAKEEHLQVRRGEPGSIATAMCYGEYYPAPGSIASSKTPFEQSQLDELRTRVSHSQAFVAEFFGTAVLVFAIFSLTAPRNSGKPLIGFEPIWIGLTVSCLISVIGPLTQACFNPARDFGPRLFAYFAGWGTVAWPMLDDLSWLTVYIIAPILGGVVGGGISKLNGYR